MVCQVAGKFPGGIEGRISLREGSEFFMEIVDGDFCSGPGSTLSGHRIAYIEIFQRRGIAGDSIGHKTHAISMSGGNPHH